MYDFKKLSDVELLTEVPEGASAFVEVDGDVKRVPGSGLGGGGVATAILRYNADAEGQNAEGGIAVQDAASPILTSMPITCDNYTYAQAKAILDAGQPLAVMSQFEGWSPSMVTGVDSDGYIVMLFILDGESYLYWDANGFYRKQSK